MTGNADFATCRAMESRNVKGHYLGKVQAAVAGTIILSTGTPRQVLLILGNPRPWSLNLSYPCMPIYTYIYICMP